MSTLHPLDAALLELGLSQSGLAFPPDHWKIIKPWGYGYALQHGNGLRVIVDCELKDDGGWWVHVSVSRANRTPSHEEMALVKRDFIGDRYAYSVWAPEDQHVNIHAHCLHIWALVDRARGMVLPEFSAVLPRVGRSI